MSWRTLLAHHRHPQRLQERCLQVGGLHVCRRCTAIWPLTFLVLLLSFALQRPISSEHALLFWCAPPAAEFMAVHAGGRRYRPGRAWVFGLCLGVGLGLSFHRYLSDPSDPVPWVLWLTLGLPCLWAAGRSSLPGD